MKTQILVALVAIATALWVVDGVGDEYSYFSTDNEDLSGKFRCEPSIGAPPFPMEAGGYTRRYRSVDICDLLFLTDASVSFAGEVVILDNSKMKDRCTLKQVIEAVENQFDAEAFIMANDLLGYRVYAFNMTSYLGRDGKIPSCMISESDGVKLAGRSGVLHMHDGAYEDLSIHTTDASVTVFVDGSLQYATNGAEFSGFFVRDTYETIAVVVKNAKKGMRGSFQISVSDFFGTNAETWYCSVKQFPTGEDDYEWKTNGYTFPQDSDWMLAAPRFSDASPNISSWQTASIEIWSAQKAPDGFVCRASKRHSSIVKGGFEYTLVETPLTWRAADDQCKKTGGHLASIHSSGENALVLSLLPPPQQDGKVSTSRLWLGLNLGPDNTLKWKDGTLYNYENFAKSPGWVTDRKCALMTENGEWVYEKCDNTFSSICKRAASKGSAPTDDRKCLMFFNSSANDGQWGVNPKWVFPWETKDMCVFGSSGHFSCCSTNYLNSVVARRLEHVSISEPRIHNKCYDRLREAVCFDCQANQGEYVYWDAGAKSLNVNVCNDTCTDLWDKCASEVSNLVDRDEHTPTNAIELCKHLFQEEWLGKDHGNGLTAKIVDPRQVPGCFRIDGEPPKVVERRPPIDGEVFPDTKEFRVIFDESIQIQPLHFLIFQMAGAQKRYDFYYTYDSPFIYLGTTYKPDDTIVIDLEIYETKHGQRCIFSEGSFEVSFGASQVFDLAGNAFVVDAIWTLFSKTPCYEPNYSGVYGIVGTCSLMMLAMLFLYVKHLRDVRFGNYNNSDNLPASQAQPLETPFQRMGDDDVVRSTRNIAQSENNTSFTQYEGGEGEDEEDDDEYAPPHVGLREQEMNIIQG